MSKSKNILLIEDSSGEAKGICTRISEISEFNINVHWSDTCDKALQFCKREEVIDMIIVDLHYKKEDRSNPKIENGEDFIIQMRKCFESPPPIMVYSMIDQPVTLDLLVNSIGVDGYIIKGRKSLNELAFALNLILIGEQYISKEVRQILNKNKNALDITRMDRAILRKLYNGSQIKQLPKQLKDDGFTACGQATVENRIRDLKDYFDAKTTLQLVAIAKEQKVFMS